jgi:hypothetical protein
VSDPAAMCRRSLGGVAASGKGSSLPGAAKGPKWWPINVTPPGEARSKPQTPRAERRDFRPSEATMLVWTNSSSHTRPRAG